jgi:tetraacyldisaccharide 4'-kinase
MGDEDIMKDLLRQIITGKDHSIMGAFLKPVLSAFSFIYRIAVILTQRAYSVGFRPSYKARKPVISVGNITAGGVGKTPLVILIAEHFAHKKFRPAVITRGYMAGKASSDEAQMLAAQLKDVPVVVDPDRVAAVKGVEKDVDVLVLDDGFQHWPLKRDVDIVAIDAMNPFGNGALLPRGLLREPLEALSRADVFVLTRTDLGRINVPDVRKKLAALNAKAFCVETVHAPGNVLDLWTGEPRGGLSSIKERVIALCAIGSPDAFKAMLLGEGVDVIRLFAFDDHYIYSEKDVYEIVAFCRKQDIKTILTTAKDAVKIKGFQKAFQGVGLLVVEVKIKVVHGETEFFSRLDRCCHP